VSEHLNTNDNRHAVNDQLDRIEAKVDKVVSRVDRLEAKASVWGAVGGILIAVASKLAGCM
jgi:tetrahydromethanopterin S-methyltransferase subunit G